MIYIIIISQNLGRIIALDPLWRRVSASVKAAWREQNPLSSISPICQFKNVLYSFVKHGLAIPAENIAVSNSVCATLPRSKQQAALIPAAADLRKLNPYWHSYTSYAKKRWVGRPILEVWADEFEDRNTEYYVSYKFCAYMRSLANQGQRYALESGMISVNNRAVKSDYIVKVGDRIECVLFI